MKAKHPAPNEFTAVWGRLGESFGSIVMQLAKAHTEGPVYVFDNYTRLQNLWNKRCSRWKQKHPAIANKSQHAPDHDVHAKANLLEYLRTVDRAAYDQRAAMVSEVAKARAATASSKVGAGVKKKEEEEKEEEVEESEDDEDVEEVTGLDFGDDGRVNYYSY